MKLTKKSTLPLLAHEVRKNKVDFSDTVLFVVQHMKENTVEFLRQLKKSGFKQIVLIGKPYSRDHKFDKIYEKIATVVTPSFEELEQPQFIKTILSDNLTSKSKYICFDMSGYFSKYFAKHKPPQGLLGVVEETKNGLWFDPKHKFNFPMLSVASGKMKDYGESCFIAKAIARSTEHLLLNAHQKIFTGTNVLILGYGIIGKYLADTLKPQTCVSIYDIRPQLRFKAFVEGFTVLQDLKQIAEFDVIIAVTGTFSLKKELLSLKNNVVLVNGSTGKREYDFRTIQPSIISREELEYETLYTLKNKNKIYVLAHGYPVNFFRSESIPEYILDLVLTEMFVLAKHLATHKHKPGYFPIETAFPEIESELAELWLKQAISLS